MENKKGSGIFLGVIGVATLIVAIIGATFAFFSANAASNATAIQAQGATLKLGYSDDNGDNLKYHLIPAEDVYAKYGALNQLSQDEIDEKKEADDDFVYDGNLQCLDDNGNEICGVYTFNIGNPSFTTQQGLYGNITISENGFGNLYFAIYDEQNNEVVGPTNFAEAAVDNVIVLDELNQDLLPSRLDDTNSDGKADNGTFNELDPTTYTKICTYGEMYDDDGNEGTPNVKCEKTNVRTYKMVIWIHEIGSNQTALDSGMMFAAGINFTSASDTTGVTGIIAAAKDQNGGAATTAEATTTDAG